MSKLSLLAMVVLPLGLLALGAGCEVEPAGSPITVTPASAVLRYKQAIEFTASGGYEYSWSTKATSYGFLSGLTGPKVIFTSLYNPEGVSNTTQTVTLTVTSTIPGSGGTSNSSPSSVSTDVNIILQ